MCCPGGRSSAHPTAPGASRRARSSTGAWLAMTEPGAGKVFGAGGEIGVMDALVRAMELDAAEDQRATSTS